MIIANLDELVKSQKRLFYVIPVSYQVRDKLQPAHLPYVGQASRKNKYFWTPAFAGVTALITFYEFVYFNQQKQKNTGCNDNPRTI